MDYRPLAMERLRNYNALKQAVENIPLEIQALQYEMVSLQSAWRSDSVSSGKANAREDFLIQKIMRIRELELSYAHAKVCVESVDRAMSSLLQHEKLILYRIDIEREKFATIKLCEEMDCETASVYRRRDKALDNLTRAMFGCLDTDDLKDAII